MPGVPPARYAYLGPEGTFAEAALRTLPAASRGDLQPHASVTAALEAVRRGEADHALVPIENSVEGSVSATLDELAVGDPLMVTREVLLPVSFALMARPGTGLHDVRRVATHPHAEAQCRRWLATVLPDAVVVPAPSTAAAAAGLADGSAGHDAAIAAPIAAEHYRLEVLAARRRGQPGRGHPVRARQPAGRAAAADRARQDVVRGVHRRRPPGRAARGAHRVRGPRRQPDPDRVAARPASGSAATASPSTARATSTTPGSARRCPGCAGSAPTSGSSAPTRGPTSARPPRRRPATPPTKDAIYRDAAAWLGRIRNGKV